MSDPWITLRTTTRARIGLGRTGDALPVKEILEFQLAHARARDAVHTPLNTDALALAVAPLASVKVHSKARDRETYLRRPDLGRQLDLERRPPDGNSPADKVAGQATGMERADSSSQPERASEGCPLDRQLPTGPYDAVFVIADGLSPVGVQLHAVPMLRACLERLADWSLAPVVIATQARVALGDEIGALLQADFSVVLIGERPGLSVASSLGVYLTFHPRIGRRDSERNCISNIHPDGLSYNAAADMLAWLMTEARRRKLTGVDLKDHRAIAAPATQSSPERLPAPRRLE